MSRTTVALERLRAADPLAAATSSPPTPAVRRTRRSHRGVRLAVSAVTVSAMAVVAFVLLPGGAAAPSDARAVESLLAAGRAAAAAVDAPLQPGQVVYSKVMHQYLGEVSTTSGGTAVYLAGVQTDESWIGRDGALSRLEDPTGPPWYPTAHDRAVVEGQHVPAPRPQTITIGASTGSVNAPTYDFARTLPTDPGALEQRIRLDTAGSGESPDAEVWVTVKDMLLSPVCPPALRAALYQVAASLPGVEYLGATTDRLGRRGIAVALSHGDDLHARSREVLVFDPDTGLLLQYEQRALDPVQYGLPASMKDRVVGWQVWVGSGVVDGVGLRPDGSHADLTG